MDMIKSELHRATLGQKQFQPSVTVFGQVNIRSQPATDSRSEFDVPDVISGWAAIKNTNKLCQLPIITTTQGRI